MRNLAAPCTVAVALAICPLAVSGCADDSPARPATFKAEVRHAQVGDLELAYYERGSGPPLLMNMGSSSTMSEWDPALLELLAERHKLIIYDYRGIGLSSRISPRGLTIERLADDAVGLLDALQIERADVLGWSLGGFVAQQIATRRPDRVGKLILAATNPGGSRTTFGPPRAQRIDSDPNATDSQILSVNFPRTPAGRRAGRGFLRRLDSASEAGTIPNDFTVPRSGFEAQSRAESRWYADNSNLAKLHLLSMPVMIAVGGLDELTPPANSQLIRRRIPGSQLRWFDGAGHAVLFQDRRRFARYVNELIGP